MTRSALGVRFRIARRMADRNDHHIVRRELVVQGVRVGRCEQATYAGFFRCLARKWMAAKQPGQIHDALLYASGAMLRMSGDVVERGFEFGQRLRRVAELHKPCFRQTAATSSSVANSRRPACSSEAARDARSSGDSATDAGSFRAAARIKPASSSCLSGGNARAASSAILKSSVMMQDYRIMAGDAMPLVAARERRSVVPCPGFKDRQ